MLLPYRNLHLAQLMILSFILVAAGCSHTTAYINEPAHPGTEYADQVRQRVLLVGDAGAPKSTGCKNGKDSCEPVLKLMARWANEPVGGKKPFSIFLGDNIYPDGLPDGAKNRNDKTRDSKRDEAEEKWDAQYEVLTNSKSKGMFVPGNHDWGGAFGPYHDFWVRQQNFLEEKQRDGFLVVPKLESGCPWPVSINNLDGVKIVVLNTQWWLTDDKMKEVKPCARGSVKSIADAQDKAVKKLAEMLRQSAAANEDVIVATHHPMATHGVHGASYRAFSQDIRGKKYKEMVKALKNAYRTSGAPPLIHAAGHDHSLQVLRGVDDSSATFTLVSGAGSHQKLQSVSDGEDTLFAHEHTGFMVVDFMQSGSVYLQVIEPAETNDRGKRVYFTQLR